MTEWLDLLLGRVLNRKADTLTQWYIVQPPGGNVNALCLAEIELSLMCVVAEDLNVIRAIPYLGLSIPCLFEAVFSG